MSNLCPISPLSSKGDFFSESDCCEETESSDDLPLGLGISNEGSTGEIENEDDGQNTFPTNATISPGNDETHSIRLISCKCFI